MDVQHACREALKSFPGARILYLGADLWLRLKNELQEPHLRYAVIEDARVQYDPGLKPGEMEVVRVPDVWTLKDEKKPRRKPVQKRKRKG